MAQIGFHNRATRSLLILLLITAAWFPYRHTPSQDLHRSIATISPDFRVLLEAEIAADGSTRLKDHHLGHFDVPSWLPDGSGFVAWSPIKEQLFQIKLGQSEKKVLKIDGAPCHTPAEHRKNTCIDPAVIALSDGSWRMYYVITLLGEDPVGDRADEELHSARSFDKGQSWLPEPGPLWRGASFTDPDPVLLKDGRIRLYYSSNQSPEQPTQRAPVILSLISADGLIFEAETGVRLMNASASATLVREDGGFEIYAHGLDSSILRYSSADGLRFHTKSSLDFSIPRGFIGIEAPALRLDSDGTRRGLFSTIDEPYFPFNFLLKDHMTAESSFIHHLSI